jgi:hypothetical protein
LSYGQVTVKTIAGVAATGTDALYTAVLPSGELLIFELEINSMA